MPDPQLHDFSDDPFDSSEPTAYRIQRKGSRYNITGPGGRVFTKYKSASVVGPRWEELTHTPWPYESSAYLSGTRLWELGLIERWQVGQRAPAPKPALPPAPKPQPRSKKRARVQRITISLTTLPLSLPAPRINLEEQKQLMQTLRRDPALLFESRMQQTLLHEVEYHLPGAKWAQHLLKLLARYERRR